MLGAFIEKFEDVEKKKSFSNKGESLEKALDGQNKIFLQDDYPLQQRITTVIKMSCRKFDQTSAFRNSLISKSNNNY